MIKRKYRTDEIQEIDFGDVVLKYSTSGFNGGRFNVKKRNVGEKRKLPPISDNQRMKKIPSTSSAVKGEGKVMNLSMLLPHVPIVSVSYCSPLTSTSTKHQIQTSNSTLAWGITPSNQKTRQFVTRHSIIQKHMKPKEKEKDQVNVISDLVSTVPIFGMTSYEGNQPIKYVEPQSDNDVSSSSPSVPYSTTDILYNGETHRSSLTDDYSPNDLVYPDKPGRLKDVDNRRPSSKNNTRRSISLEKVSLNIEKDELQPIKPAAISKQNHFRPTGVRQSYLRGEQFYNNNNQPVKSTITTNGSSQVSQKEDLVAMGTLWNPNAVSKNNVLSITSNNKPYTTHSLSSPGSLAIRRPQPPTSRFNMGTGGSRGHRDVEPKYSDPAIGATNSYQQRLIDLSALEADTIRWERNKKVKKKPKQDRDS